MVPLWGKTWHGADVMILLGLFVFLIIGSDHVIGNRPKNRYPQRAGSSSSAVATAYGGSSSSSSSSNSYSYSSASSSGCNDFNPCNDRNATFKRYPNPCPGTCENPEGDPNCYRICREYGCECNPGYVVSDNGKCILLQDCPDYLRCGDPNAIFKQCPNPCPRTCRFPGGSGPCNKMCLKEGCECKDGYYLSEEGNCVKLQDCPGARKCTANETFAFCNAGCPNNFCPSDDSRGIIACSQPFPCASGCSCKGGYLRLSNEDNRCLLAYECPEVPCTRPNEEWNGCPPPCFSDKCSSIGRSSECDKRFFSCRPQCICKPGFFRNDSDICVPQEECPPQCGYNEMRVRCKTVCPPQSCDISYTEYDCGNTTKPCEPGCDCLPNYLKNASGICIPNDECPPRPPFDCGYNEKPSYCRVTCPPQTCDSIFSTYDCTNNTVCEPGCDCLDEYLRNASGVCVPSIECFFEPDCDITTECRATCANPNPQNCPSVDTVTDNQDGCKCKPGYILSDTSGVCIPIEECPADIGCDGDPNAIATSCPWPCPSTCDSPNAGSCGKECKPVGCQCKPGFILSEINGKCILPDKCEYGNPCGVNETFSDCAFRCPNQICPQDDSGIQIFCKPGRPCPPGCLCKEYYRRKSATDDTCVLAPDCPIVECTRPNEFWNPYASECLAEACTDINKKNDCFGDPNNYQPKCVCIEGFYRNSSGYCVTKEECKLPCQVPPECRPTCAVPNPPGCPFVTPSETNEDGCNCQQGYILSKTGGSCIKIEECPINIGCNGDPHARVKEYPQPCPSTCDSPNAPPCKRKSDPIGCECEPGYILSEINGQCIPVDDCKGGNPCGPNGTFVPCRYICLSSYCPKDDSRAVVICENFPFAPCYSGCVCKLNHRILSTENPICIRSDECPEVNCTRPYEKWNSCPMECQSEYCESVDVPPAPCNTLVLNCNPNCVCKKSFYRDPATDFCVTSDECRRINKENQPYA